MPVGPYSLLNIFSISKELNKMSDNAPEYVDLDEKFNQLDPVFLERALRLNLTASMRAAAHKSVDKTMPTILLSVAGIKPTQEALMDCLLDAYTALVIVGELSKLVDEIAPLKEVDNIPEAQRAEVRALIATHPMIKKTVRVINEALAEIHGR